MGTLIIRDKNGKIIEYLVNGVDLVEHGKADLVNRSFRDGQQNDEFRFAEFIAESVKAELKEKIKK